MLSESAKKILNQVLENRTSGPIPDYDALSGYIASAAGNHTSKSRPKLANINGELHYITKYRFEHPDTTSNDVNKKVNKISTGGLFDNGLKALGFRKTDEGRPTNIVGGIHGVWEHPTSRDRVIIHSNINSKQDQNKGFMGITKNPDRYSEMEVQKRVHPDHVNQIIKKFKNR